MKVMRFDHVKVGGMFADVFRYIRISGSVYWKDTDGTYEPVNAMNIDTGAMCFFPEDILVDVVEN